MKVKFVKTGKVLSFDDGYAARLVEQGVAVVAKEKIGMNEPEPELDAQPEEAKQKSGKKQKG